MINLRDKSQSIPAGILGLALVIAAGTGLYMVLAPVPTPAAANRTATNSKNKLIKQVTDEHGNEKIENAIVAESVFPGQQQDAEAATLALVTRLSNQRNLKVGGFRPQNGVDAGQLTQLPFIISVTGRFADVVGFTRDLEAKGTKLAVNNVQLAASDTSTDTVTANINAVGYLNQPFTVGGQNG